MATTALRFDILARDRASGTLNKIGGSAEKTSGKLSGMGKVASAALGGAVVAGAAIGLSKIKSFASGSVDAFAAVEDATGAAGVQFGKALPQVLRFADQATKSFGLSKRQAIEAANTFGTMGKSAGLAEKPLADFTSKLTGLAGDLASFKGTSTEQAIQAIGAALRGETEPIRAYGVMLDDASLRQEALAQGLVKTTKEALSPQNKVLAAQALILKQTTDAQGDFARTSDSTANTQKRLAAETENVQAALGEKLAPAITWVRERFLDVLKFVNGRLMPGLSVLADRMSAPFTAMRGAVSAAIDRVGPVVQSGLAAAGALAGAVLDKAPEWNFGNKIVNRVRFGMESGDWAPLKKILVGEGTALGSVIETAREWNFGNQILNRVQFGLAEGDWGPLGKAIRTGLQGIDPTEVGRGLNALIRNALRNIGDVASALTRFLGEMIQKVDWGALSFAIGRQVPTLMLGLVTGILNFDIGSALSFIKNHWFEVLMGLLAIAFAPARMIAGFARILGKIPLVGPFLSWGALAIKGFSDKMIGWIGTAMSRFASGFMSNFPKIGGAFSRGFESVRVTLFVWGDDMVKWVKALPGRFQSAIGAGIEAFGRFVGRTWIALWEGVKRTSGAAMSAVGAVVLLAVDGIMAALQRTFDVLGKLPGKLGAPFRAASDAVDGARGKVQAAARELDNLGRQKASPRVELIGIEEVRRQVREVNAMLADTGSRRRPVKAAEIFGDGLGIGAGGDQPRGVKSMMAALPAGTRLISGFRPGAVTATGNASYHGKGRAVDIPPSMALFNYIKERFPNSRELIFSPAGGRQLHNGRERNYTGVTRANHWDHVHWAMANGGVINEPVVGMGLSSGKSYAFGERGPETVLPGVHSPGGDRALLEAMRENIAETRALRMEVARLPRETQQLLRSR